VSRNASFGSRSAGRDLAASVARPEYLPCFAERVDDDHEGGKRLGPPQARRSVEDEPGQDGDRPDPIHQGDPALRVATRMAGLGDREIVKHRG